MRLLLATCAALSTLALAYPSDRKPDSVAALAQHGNVALPPSNHARAEASDFTRPGRHLTNAKRLAMGIPLTKPRKLQSERDGPLSALDIGSFRDFCTEGWIYVTDINNVQIGYLAAPLDSSGVFASTVNDVSDPNVLNVCLGQPDIDTMAADLLDSAASDNSTFPFIGAILSPGSSPDISVQNADFVYTGLVAQTSANSPPIYDSDSTANSYDDSTSSHQQYESQVWLVDGPNNNAMTMRWGDSFQNTVELEFGRTDTGEFIAAPGGDHSKGRGVGFTPVLLSFSPAEG